MNKLSKILKKNWILIWLVAVTLSLLSVSTYAIYTRITIAKRVVSTQAGAGGLFSSDHMGASGMRIVEPVTDASVDATIPFRVYNYVYPKEAIYRNENTEYDLTATLGTLDGSNVFTPVTDAADIAELANLNYSITYNTTSETFSFGGSNPVSHTFYDCVIEGGSANDDLFTLTYDKSEFGLLPKNYVVKLEATPYSGDLPRLVGYVLVRFSKQASTGWKGEVEELNNSKINDYDGFNYYLDGNGEGTLTFKWKPAYVTINKQFLNNPDNSFVGYTGSAPVEANLTPDANGYVSLTINVNSEEKNRYEVQFYKVDPTLSYTKADVSVYLPATDASDWVPST